MATKRVVKYTTVDQARAQSLRAPAPPKAPKAAAAPSVPGSYVGAVPGPAVGPTALPVDPTYDAQVGAAERTRGDTLAGLTQQRQAGLLSYGYREQQNPDGTTASIDFDATNPYSQAALAKTHYNQAKTGTANSLAARGQIWSGAMLNAQNANDASYNQQDDALQKGVMQFLANNTIAARNAGNSYDTTVSTAAAGRLDRAPESPLYNPVAPVANAYQPVTVAKPVVVKPKVVKIKAQRR